MRTHHTTRRAAHRILAALAALTAASAIAACGAGAPTHAGRSTSSNPETPGNSSSGPGLSTSSAGTITGVAFSRCMRANGVPNFPDLRSNGRSGSGMLIQASGQTLTVNGVSVSGPAFVAAKAKCERYLPHQPATPAKAAEQRQRGLKFAKCMRSHGVPNFSDPNDTSSSGNNQIVRLPPGTIDSPAFQAAAKACGGGPKGPIS